VKISKKQLKKIITESLFDDAADYVSSMFSSGYTPGDIVSTDDVDPYEYKEQREKWVYRKKDSSDTWRKVNKKGAYNLNKRFKKEPEEVPEDLPEDLPEDEKVTDASGVYKGLVERNIIDDGDTLLLIDGVNQKFYLKKSESGNEMSGKVSTGKNGFGNTSGSGTTSTGLMKVTGISGKGLESGTVLVGKSPTEPPIVLGRTTSSPRKGHTAEVLTRAIVLSGMESKNRNVRSRSIYVHGTNREHKLGSRASGGCIRMSSKNIIKLADSEIKKGDYVYIFDGPASLTSTVRGHVGSLVDRGLSMFAEENKVKDTHEKEDIQKVGGVNASDDEIAAILAKYPPEITA